MTPTDPFDPRRPTENLSRSGRQRFTDRYEIRDELGSGAMGTVWRAHDTRLDREVAIKEVHLPDGMPPRERERARARMIREARAAARVPHPSVVTVHDVLEVDGVPFIVMELLSGESLRDRLARSGPLSETEVERMARPLLGALWAAHRVGVVHRDVKPANIMLVDGGTRPVLTDFGIANLPDHGGTALTGTGTVLGTAAYAAPERLEDEDAGPISDLWSLGATLFAALAGESPFKRETLTSTLTAVLTMPIPPPPARGRLSEVVSGLLARDPRARLVPERALALLDSPAPSTSPTPVPPPPSGRRDLRAPLWIGSVALVLLSLGGLTAWSLLPDREAEGEAAVDVSDVESPSPTPSASEEVGTVSREDVPEGFVRFRDRRVELLVPEDWEAREAEQEGASGNTRLAGYEFDTGVETGTATVLVNRYDLPLYDAEAAVLRMEELLEGDDSFDEVERLALDVTPERDGVDSAVYEVLFRHEEREVPERWMFTREMTRHGGSMSYRVSLNFPAELREEYRDDFEVVLDSFTPLTDDEGDETE
ncbi:serine/threonine-protein kinase [Nocardiopsis alba]|uniref:serine/threonine-protein kinase n=1 Tax=Nocardiopsis alba TaxID=53437 RepID=UPI0033AF3660